MRVVVAFLMCWWAAVASAQVPTCYQWRYASITSSPWMDSPEEAAQWAVDYCTPALTAGGTMKVGCTFTDPSHTHCASGTGDTPSLVSATVDSVGSRFVVHWVRQTEPFCTGVPEWDTDPTPLTLRNSPDGCPVCPEAGAKRGSIIEGEGEVGSKVCGSDGCAYSIGSPLRTVLLEGGFGAVATVVSDGRPCASHHTTADAPRSEGGPCVDGGGVIACLDPEASPPQGCGYFNGDYVCTGHVPDNSCVSFASGGVACTTGSPDTPKGPGGEPLEPDGTVTGGDGSADYFGPDTVAGATTPATTVPAVGGSATGAPGSSSSGSSGGGGGSGGDTIINCDGPDCVEVDLEGECPEGETCDGSLPNAGEFGEVCTFGECAAVFYNRVKAAPLLVSVTGAGAAMPSGSCPNWTLEAFAEDYSLSAPMCELWDSVSGVLSAIFLVIWAWVATRIVLSA